MAACHVVMLREAPASPPIMSQGSYLRVSSFPRGFHPPTPPAVVFLPSVPSVCPISPLSLPPPVPTTIRQRVLLVRVILPLPALSCVYFIFLSSRDLSLFRTRHLECVRSSCACICICKYMYVFARIHTRKVNACGPFWRLCERRHACGAHPRHHSFSLFLSPRLSSPLNPRDFSTPDRER